MTASTAFATLAAGFLGLAVIGTDKAGTATEYKIARLDTKMGKLKDGSEAEYVILQRADDENVVIALHPRSAKKLFDKGEADTFKFKPVEQGDVSEADEADEAALQEELAAEQAGIDAAEEGVKEGETVAEEAKEVKVSKKERAVAIYCEVVNAGGARKDVIKRFTEELGMSAPGASTYYQNCKGTKAVKWTA